MRGLRQQTMLTLVGAMLLPAIVVWTWLWYRSETPESGLNSPQIAQATTSGEMNAAREAVTANSASVIVSQATTTSSLRIELSYDDGTPGANLIVLCAPDGADVLMPSARRLQARSDDAGVIVHRNLAPGRYRFAFPHPGLPGVEATVRAGEETLVAARFRPGFDILGQVVDRSDRPISGAAIWVSHNQPGDAIIYSDAQGRFVLRGCRIAETVGASAAGFAPSPVRTLTADAGSERQVRLVLQGGGGAVSGHVLDVDGELVPHAQVIFANRDLPWTYRGKDQSWSLTPVMAITDAEGHFFCEGLPPLELSIEVRAGGKGMVRDRVSVTAGGISDIEIRLPATAMIDGQVLNTKGEPIADAWIGGSETGTNYQMTRSLADGSYRLEGLNPGTTRIVVFAGKDRDRMDERVDLIAGEDLERDLRFATRPQIHGRLLTNSGRTLAGWSVKARGDGFFEARAVTGPDGSFVLAGLDPSQAYRLSFYQSQPYTYANHVLREIYTSSEIQFVHLPETALSEGSIRGRVIDWRGQPLTTAEIAADRSGDLIWFPRSLDEDGGFRFANLPPGHYTIRIKDGPHWTASTELSLGPGQDIDLGELPQPRLGTISLDITGVRAADAEKAKFFDNSHLFIDSATLDAGTLENYPITPGDYHVQLLGNGQSSQEVAFTIRAGENTRVEVVLR